MDSPACISSRRTASSRRWRATHAARSKFVPLRTLYSATITWRRATAASLRVMRNSGTVFLLLAPDGPRRDERFFDRDEEQRERRDGDERPVVPAVAVH